MAKRKKSTKKTTRKKPVKKTAAKILLIKPMVSMKLVVDEVASGVLLRRKVRNIIHRIRSNRLFDKWEKDRGIGIRLIFEPQFREVKMGQYTVKMSWKNFTFVWDIHPKNPLQAVVTSEWIHAGGGYKRFGKNNDVPTRICQPTAFTMQKL